VFSGFSRDGWERVFYSCDWDLLTQGNGGIDACMLGFPIDPTPGVTASEGARISEAITATKAIANGRGVIWQAMTFDRSTEDPTVLKVVHSMHLQWEGFKSIIRQASVAAARANGRPTLVAYYPTHSGAQIEWKGEPRWVDYTLEGYGHPPPTDIPWPVGGAYPAQLWGTVQGTSQEETHRLVLNWEVEGEDLGIGGPGEGLWANRWEVEVLANFLAATDKVFPPVRIRKDTVWGGEVILLGDVEIIEGATLTLEAGSHLLFRPRTDLSA